MGIGNKVYSVRVIGLECIVVVWGQIIKPFIHLGNHSRKYLVILLIGFLIAGLWPFNFTEKNNAVISPAGGLEIARHGTVYTAFPADKLKDLKRFAIHIDLVTSSDGLNAFLEKILLCRQPGGNEFPAGAVEGWLYPGTPHGTEMTGGSKFGVKGGPEKGRKDAIPGSTATAGGCSCTKMGSARTHPGGGPCCLSATGTGRSHWWWVRMRGVARNGKASFMR